MRKILIDPLVSKLKFDREIELLSNIQDNLRAQGWIIESTSFPIVRVTFLARHLNPPLAPLTVEINFTNFNILPPSVRFLHPITFQPILMPSLRLGPEGGHHPIIIAPHPITNEPFICLPGIKEYHNHPQHTGDSWDLHRYTGEGSLYYILENIWKYSINNIINFNTAIPISIIKSIQLQQIERIRIEIGGKDVKIENIGFESNTTDISQVPQS